MSVCARRPTRPVDFDQRIKAVHAFSKLDQAAALSAANKRVSNILSKQTAEVSGLDVKPALLTEEAEIALASQLTASSNKVTPLFDDGDYASALKELANLQQAVDSFFDSVMVMAEDEAVKMNRLALLNQLRTMFLRVADISLLSK